MTAVEAKVKTNRSWKTEDMEKPKPLTGANVRFAEEVMESARGKMEDCKKGFMEQIDEQLQDLIDDCFSEIRCKMLSSQESSSSSSDDKTSKRTSTEPASPKHAKSSSSEGLPIKQFVQRDSVLTDLFRVSHIRTIYHIFTAALLLVVIQSVVAEISQHGRYDISFSMIWWTFGKIHAVLLMWVCMFLGTCTLFVLYSFWAVQPDLHTFTWDIAFILGFIHYLGFFLYYPVAYLLDHDLPVASSFIILMEQTRLMMKSYAFVRHNVPVTRNFYRHAKSIEADGARRSSPVPNGGLERRKAAGSESEVPAGPYPDFSNFLYFMFAPTLVYRDSYPRTKKVRWSYVLMNFVQVFGVIMALYFILGKQIFPTLVRALVVDAHGNAVPRGFVWILERAFNCVIPATFCALMCWFGLLHSWQNAFAEMLRFGDREFYSDWWNSTSYTRYYRKWNIVVHDWLYEYIYRDVYGLGINPFNLGRRFLPTCAVFFVSALFHEYILSVAFRFFYPVLLVMFGGFGFGFMFLPKSSNSKSLTSVAWNIFLWMNLMLGFSLLFITYSLEFFARSSCVPAPDNLLWQYLVPRSWTCSIVSSGPEQQMREAIGSQP